MFKNKEKVKFVKEWADKIKPNTGFVYISDDITPPPEGHVWVHFEVAAPPANVLLVPLNKLEKAK